MGRCADVAMCKLANQIISKLAHQQIDKLQKQIHMIQKENLILQLTLKFALDIIEYCETLEQARKYVITRQLLRSGTSIGANTREAQNPESKADFIHKLKIAAKEADETEYWLILCQHSPSYPDCTHLLEQIKSIQRVLSKIISSAKKS